MHTGGILLGLVFALWVGGSCFAQPVTSQTLTDQQYWRKAHDDFIREFPGLMQSWRESKDSAQRNQLAGKIQEGAVRYGVSGSADSGETKGNSVLEELVAGGPVAEKEVKISAPPKEIRLKPLQVFAEIGDPMARKSRDNAVWQDRRITKDALEVWSSKDGWLFDSKGKLLNHAVVPRRDGTGLQWFGAFLPDGQWVTTDLWSYDKTLFLYSKEGTFLKDLAVDDLVTPEIGEGLIGWARSDKDGKGWVFEVTGYYAGRFWTGPDLKPRKLAGIEPWTLCLPRQLGVRYRIVPSDDGNLLLSGYEAGHGNGVGYPNYYLSRLDAAKPLPRYFDPGEQSGLWKVCIPGHARNLGFWPGSHNVYINGDSAAGLGPIVWFLDEKGQCLGWLSKRLADAADGKGMLFKVFGDLIANIGNDMKCREVRKYVGAGGAAVPAYALYDDLKMGLFVEDGKLELCAWE
jgi:hypothetical protein